MAGVSVDPAEVGPRISAALSSAAAALAAPAAIPPPPPPGADPVSVAAANQVAINSGKLTAELVGGIARITEGSEAVAAALQRYVRGDTEGAALISGHGSTAGGGADAVMSALNIPAVPTVEVPDLPVDIASALSTVPAEPATVDDALRAGAGESGVEAHAAAWDSAAAEIGQAAQTLEALASGLPASWDSEASALLAQRLQTFSRWMSDGSSAAGVHASASRQVGAQWRSAVAEHPRAEYVRETYTKLMTAVSRASAGDPRAAAEAAEFERRLAEAKEQSIHTMTRYGDGAGGVNDQVERPGDSPRISGDGDPHLPNKPAGELGSVDDPHAAATPAEQLGETTGQSMQAVMGLVTQIPSMIANAVGQTVGKAGQAVGQMGQQAGQAASQLGNVLGGAGSPAGGSPLGGAGRNPLSKLGSGGDPLSGLGGGGAGGGGGGGRTMPANLPQQGPPPAVAPPAAAATPGGTGAAPRPGGMSPMGGMMPMGMMPHGRGGEGGKEVPRNKDWFPDEPLVTDDPEVSEPIAGQRRRARPTET